MLQDAKNERTREQRRSDRLETTFEENEIRIGDLQEQLDKRLIYASCLVFCSRLLAILADCLRVL